MKEECLGWGANIIWPTRVAHTAWLSAGKSRWADAIAEFAEAARRVDYLVEDKNLSEQEGNLVIEKLEKAQNLCYRFLRERAKGMPLAEYDTIMTTLEEPELELYKLGLSKACDCEIGKAPPPPPRPERMKVKPIYGEVEEEEE